MTATDVSALLGAMVGASIATLVAALVMHRATVWVAVRRSWAVLAGGVSATMVGCARALIDVVVRLLQPRSIVGAALVAAAATVPPAWLTGIVLCAAGVMLMIGVGLGGRAPAGVARPAARMAGGTAAGSVVPRFVELDRGTGVVVFRQVNGKLVSRFYRAV